MVFVVLPHHSYYRYFYPLTTVVMWLGTTKNRTFNAEKPPFGAVFLKKGGPSGIIGFHEIRSIKRFWVVGNWYFY